MGTPNIQSTDQLMSLLHDAGISVVPHSCVPNWARKFFKGAETKALEVFNRIKAEDRGVPPQDIYRFLLVDNGPGYINPGQGYKPVWGNRDKGYRSVDDGMTVSPAAIGDLVIADGDTYIGAMKDWLTFSGQVAVDAPSG
ncbi:hypothetical protein HYV84_03100, partial [Candidatus Woesearchaeota archaeon]|nr:hypothetical protein [Candidatus Woesearchaeota archaeon]